MTEGSSPIIRRAARTYGKPRNTTHYDISFDDADTSLDTHHNADTSLPLSTGDEAPPNSDSFDASNASLSPGHASDDDDDESDPENAPKLDRIPEREHGRTFSHSDVEVDVEVEVVTREAVARTKRRFSRKWIRERKGKRWTEDDFGQIISQLRMLR